MSDPSADSARAGATLVAVPLRVQIIFSVLCMR